MWQLGSAFRLPFAVEMGQQNKVSPCQFPGVSIRHGDLADLEQHVIKHVDAVHNDQSRPYLPNGLKMAIQGRPGTTAAAVAAWAGPPLPPARRAVPSRRSRVQFYADLAKKWRCSRNPWAWSGSMGRAKQ